MSYELGRNSFKRNCSQRDRLQAIHERKQQDEVRLLQEFQRFCDICPSDSRTHWSKYGVTTELMGHVKIPYDWKEFVFHRGCSHDMLASPQSTQKRHILADFRKHNQDAVYWVTAVPRATISRFTILADEVPCYGGKRSCASRLHLQSHLSKRRTDLE